MTTSDRLPPPLLAAADARRGHRRRNRASDRAGTDQRRRRRARGRRDADRHHRVRGGGREPSWPRPSRTRELKPPPADAERDAGAHDITGDEDEDTAATKLEAMRRGRAARARVAELNAKRLAEWPTPPTPPKPSLGALETGGDAMRQSPTPDPDADDEAVGSAPEHPDVLPPETETVAERAEDGSPGAPTRKTISATAAYARGGEGDGGGSRGSRRRGRARGDVRGRRRGRPRDGEMGVVSRGERAAANIDELDLCGNSRAAAAALTFGVSEEEAPIGPKEYVPEDMRRAPREYELRSSVVMHHSFGFESTKRNNCTTSTTRP